MRRLVIAALVLIGCGSEPAPRTHPLTADGPVLRDEQGRVALLRGVNARVDGVFDVSFTDGRQPLEAVPPLAGDDCARMRALGFDLLRLPINWSGVEPADGSFDDAYLAKVDAAVQCAAGAGLYVVIDLHQDAYSKEIGEDGAPLWAIQPPPTMLLGGPLTDLGDRRLSKQVQDAFTTFFAVGDASGLQAKYDAMLARVAARWADDPAVIGFEIINEPDTGEEELDPFQVTAAQTIRAAAPDKLVFFEPPTLRNLTDFVPRAKAPFPVSGAVYSPHIYTYVFQPDPTAFDNATPGELEASVMNARGEADAWGAPLWIGEWGCGPTDDAAHALWTQTEEQLADRYLASNAYWVWKEESQAGWGLYDHDATTGAWTERPLIVSWLSRVHAARIAGTPTRVESTVAGDAIHVEGAGGDAPGVFYIPERYASAFHARCNGAEVAATRDAATGLIEITCAGAIDVGNL